MEISYQDNAQIENSPSQIATPFSERVKTCFIDYVADKDYLITDPQRIQTGNTYLSCLYHTIL